MTYEVLDAESGDVLAEFSSLDDAKQAASSYIDSHAQYVDDLAIAELDDRGRPTSVRPAAEVLELVQ